MLEKIKIYWLQILTASIILFAIIVFTQSDKLADAAQFGDFLAGFAGTLAFLWLIASLKQQQKELTVQRKELTLQRKAIQLQAKELKNIGKFSALEQVERIIKQAIKDIKQSDTPTEDYSKLVNVITSPLFMSTIEICSDSADKALIIDAYNKWAPVEIEFTTFISRISTALKIYLEQTVEEGIDYSLNDTLFVQKYINHVRSIPHLSELYGTLTIIIPSFISFEPMFKLIQAAGFAAMYLSLGNENLFNTSHMDMLKKNLDDHQLTYPKILNVYLESRENKTDA